MNLKIKNCLAIFAPLEGGYETRLLRRMRAKGFKTFITSARGLGDHGEESNRRKIFRLILRIEKDTN